MNAYHTTLEAKTVKELRSHFVDIVNEFPITPIFRIDVSDINKRKKKSNWQASLRIEIRHDDHEHCSIFHINGKVFFGKGNKSILKLVANVLKHSENLPLRLFGRAGFLKNGYADSESTILLNTDLIESTVIDDIIGDEFISHTIFKGSSERIYGKISSINNEMLSCLKVNKVCSYMKLHKYIEVKNENEIFFKKYKAVTDLIYSQLSDEEKLIVELGVDFVF